MALDPLLRLQAIIRGHSVRSKLKAVNVQFLEIVQEIEGDTSLVNWTTNERLNKPTFLENTHLPRNSAGRRKPPHSNDSNSCKSTEAEEASSYDNSVQTVMCETGTITHNKQIDNETLNTDLELPVKRMEDFGCQVAFSNDVLDSENERQIFTVTMGDTENEKDVDHHDDEAVLPVSRQYASEVSSVTSGEQLECPDDPASVMLTQKELSTVKASSPVCSVKMASPLPPSLTPLQQPSAVHAESLNIQCLKVDSRARLSRDSSIFDVTQLSSTWPSDDESGEIDQMEDRAALEKKREELALELVWIRQAIESRKQYLAIKSKLEQESAASKNRQL
jgi:hypothetical protein